MKSLYIGKVALILAMISCHTSVAQRNVGLQSGSEVTTPNTNRGTIVVYPGHNNQILESDLYDVRVLQGGKTQRLFVYKVAAPLGAKGDWDHGAGWYRSKNVSYSFATFSYEGTVVVEVRKLSGKLQKVSIRPSRLGIASKVVDARTIRFELSRTVTSPGQKLSIEFGDENRDRLLLFADPLEHPATLPDRQAHDTQIVTTDSFKYERGRRTVVFEPGVHNVGFWRVPVEVRHIYLSGGAYLYGAFEFGQREKILVNGRGVISGEKFRYRACRSDVSVECSDKSWLTAIHLLSYRGSSNFRLEGITLTRPVHYAINGWGAKNVVLENFKIVGSFQYEEDGVDVTSQSRIRDCFVNSMDDSFKMYFEAAAVSNCVVWQGLNGAVFQYGWYKKTSGGNVVTDIDVIHADWSWGKGEASTDTQTNNNAVFGYMPGKDFTGTIANEIYRRIRIETPVLRVFGFRVPEGQIIRNMLFEDVSVSGLVRDVRWKTNYFWADGGTVDGVNLSRFMVGGKLVTKDNAFATGALEFLGGANATFNQ